MQKFSTCLWFDTQAEEAANFYVSLFDDSEVTNVQRLDGTPSGDNVALVFFRLAGNEFFAINGGPQFPFTEAVSIHVGVREPGRGRPAAGTRSPPTAARRASAAGSRTGSV